MLGTLRVDTLASIGTEIIMSDIPSNHLEEALQAGIKTIHAGMFTSRFGSIVQKVIESHGLKPIVNLTGHQMGRYLLHTGRSLPNVTYLSTSRVNAAEVYAIEPFVTLKNAAGRVENSKEACIFRFVKQKSLKNEDAKKLYEVVKELPEKKVSFRLKDNQWVEISSGKSLFNKLKFFP
jgi:methionine aminopeptidase